jgi:SAM-dependent methyltransferase
MAETFQPIAVRAPHDNRFLFWARCLLDLQLLTIYRFLRPELRPLRGRVLDVGAGRAPWRELLTEAQYVGVDIEKAGGFGMPHDSGIVYYDGKRFPFENASFDHVICVEVMEHVPQPQALLSEIRRVLRPAGTLILTVPWSARLHHLPHDYYRYTRNGLTTLLQSTGFKPVEIVERGNDIAAIANKTLVLLIRLVFPRPRLNLMWTWPLAVLVLPATIAFIVAAHTSMWLGRGATEDPLGYAVRAMADGPAQPDI